MQITPPTNIQKIRIQNTIFCIYKQYGFKISTKSADNTSYKYTEFKIQSPTHTKNFTDDLFQIKSNSSIFRATYFTFNRISQISLELIMIIRIFCSGYISHPGGNAARPEFRPSGNLIKYKRKLKSVVCRRGSTISPGEEPHEIKIYV